MASELVEWLRARRIIRVNDDGNTISGYRNPDGPEAVDRITALEAEVARAAQLAEDCIAAIIRGDATSQEIAEWTAALTAIRALDSQSRN